MKTIKQIPLFILFLLTCLILTPKLAEESFSKREIASIPNSSQVLDELLSFKLSNKKTPNNMIEALEYYSKENTYRSYFEFKDRTNSLPQDVAYKIVPALDDGAFKFDILYSQKAIHDYYSFVEIKRFLSLLTREKYTTRYHFFELFYNAKKDHSISLYTLSNLRKLSFDAKSAESLKKNELQKENEITLKYWTKKLDELKEREKIERAKITLLRKQRVAKNLDIKNKNIHKQIQTLAAKNNRQGVATLLERVLPWEEMAPLELRFFKDHLEYIRKPLPIEKRVLIFRGIDSNTIFLDATNPKGATIKEAMETGNIFLTSHYLDNNKVSKHSIENLHQLPFLTDNFSKHSNFYQRATPLTSFFDGHALKSENSPLISTTSDIEIAFKYGQEKLAMFAVDPRALYFNYASRYIHESEFLIPFLNFPDEMAGIITNNTKTPHREITPNGKALLIKKLDQSFIDIYSQDYDHFHAEALLNQLKANTKKEFSFLNKDYDYVNMNKQIDKIIKEVIPSTPRLQYLPMTPSSLDCSQMIKNFINKR